MSLSLQMGGDEALLLALLHDADEDDQRILAVLRDPQHQAYRILSGAQVVGALVMHWDAQESEIVYIAIQPAQRGAGYGRQAIALLMEEARRRGVASLLVGTANSSLGNIAFYQKCGFRMTSVRRDFFAALQPPVYEDGIRMRDLLLLRCDLL